MSAELLGSHVRRVDMPGADLLALTLAGRELRGVLLIGLTPATRGVGFCDRRPIGELKSPLLLRAKKHVEGGRVVAAERLAPARLRVRVERAGEAFTLETVMRGAHGNVLLRDAAGVVLAALYPPAHEDAAADDAVPEPLEALQVLRAAGERMLLARGESAVEHARRALDRALRVALRRLERRLEAIERDRVRIEQVSELRRRAGLLLTHLHALPRGASGRLELLDESVDPPERVALEVDPLLGAKRQAESWFQTARRLERGAAFAAQRAELTHTEIAKLRALAAKAAEQTATEAQLAELAAQARVLGVAVETSPAPQRARAERPTRVPYRQFIGSGGRTILVGRGAEDNDRLTLSHARPHDLWLHARDGAGAHVVVPLERGQACPSELLADAATLAAHFSQSRGEPRVDVIHVERRHVRKPRKSPAGQVTVAREKVFRLELQPDRLRRLLAAERKLPE